MWNLLRCLIVAFALVGFIGQTTARAMPMTMDVVSEAAAQTGTAMMDCADMPGMADMAKAPPSPFKSPCKGMTADCIGKMGCATTATPLPAALSLAGSVVYAAVRFADSSQLYEGLAPQLPFHPPKTLA
ncbi:hypothetical protein [Phenylobacterium sp. 58.2.17]|uniref:hypothetical protein n=1 Tax=Phenylobacterium sp. 58.2.17 TaxID=2969306 RepID=UPI0022641D30|nr:hypothetical protein [Phenylobacterium sp. 58.2.17]MCX7587799.1 hypothetical protein [Phenylobacterium sp. 58.2.17]